ncbi:MAG: pantetheine-phosphate adenylyltransferase [Desulfovibrionaceae bacterium]|nr:pantetheine-phosphate adenylyltransferase [Desulfovibrionaceae bacterium]
MSIAQRAATIFSPVVVAITEMPDKEETFSLKERYDMVFEAFRDNDNIIVESFSGLLVDYVKSKGASVVIRGMRAIADFEYEFQLALANRKLSPSIETLFFMTDNEYLFISSSMVKSIAKHHGDISSFVPHHVAYKLHTHFADTREK